MNNILEQVFRDLAHAQNIPASSVPFLTASASPMFNAIIRDGSASGHMKFVGICGAQGSGKTTITEGLAKAIRRTGLTVAALSIDDFYLTRAKREQLARKIHPLFRTRGVPGTHDMDRATKLLDRLAAAAPGEPVPLPAFNKASDDRVPMSKEPVFHGRPEIVLIEGWCMGAVPQSAAELATPVNRLEEEEDRDGIWRGHVNAQLAGPYREFFERIDLLIMLKAPSFEQVYAWRLEQEQKLAARILAAEASLATSKVMDEAELARFIMLYERLTRHIIEEMPSRADVVVELDRDRRPVRIA